MSLSPTGEVSCCLGFNSSNQDCATTCGFDSQGNPTDDMIFAAQYCSGTMDNQYLVDSLASALTDVTSTSYLTNPTLWSQQPNLMGVAPRLAAGPCYVWASTPGQVDNDVFNDYIYNKVKTPFCTSDPTNPWCACMNPQDSIWSDTYNTIIGATQDGTINFEGGNTGDYGVEGIAQCWWFPCKNTDLTETLIPFQPNLICPNEILCVVSGTTISITGSSGDTINFVNQCGNPSPAGGGGGSGSGSLIAVYVGVAIGALFLIIVSVWAITLAVKKPRRIASNKSPKKPRPTPSNKKKRVAGK